MCVRTEGSCRSVLWKREYLDLAVGLPCKHNQMVSGSLWLSRALLLTQDTLCWVSPQGLCQPGCGTKRVSRNLALSPSCWYPRYQDTHTEGEIPDRFSKKLCFVKELVGPRRLGLSHLFILKAGLVHDCLGHVLKTQWVESMSAPEQALYLTSAIHSPLALRCIVCFVCVHLTSLCF